MTELLLRLFVKNYRQTDDPAVRGAVGSLAGITGIACNCLLFLGKLIEKVIVYPGNRIEIVWKFKGHPVRELV